MLDDRLLIFGPALLEMQILHAEFQWLSENPKRKTKLINSSTPLLMVAIAGLNEVL